MGYGARWNHFRVPNDNPVNSSLIPTGLTEPWTRFDGAPIGGTAEAPTYFDDESNQPPQPTRQECN